MAYWKMILICDIVNSLTKPNYIIWFKNKVGAENRFHVSTYMSPECPVKSGLELILSLTNTDYY